MINVIDQQTDYDRDLRKEDQDFRFEEDMYPYTDKLNLQDRD
jgi:hypothetical protein